MIGKAMLFISDNASFNGWFPEREELYDEWSKRDGEHILDSLINVWKGVSNHDPFMEKLISNYAKRYMETRDAWNSIFLLVKRWK